MVDTLFALVNVLVLSVCMVYVFKTYIIISLRQEMEDERQQVVHLCDAQGELERAAKEVARHSYQQQELCRMLSQKVVMWQKVVQARIEKERQACQERQERLGRDTRRQRMFREMQRLQSRGLPQALGHARLELYNHFQQTQAGRAYVSSVIQQVNKKGSS